jgi:SAM-dependent methyltransferase
LFDCPACGVGFAWPMRAADAAWYAASPLYLQSKLLHLALGWHHRRFLAWAGRGSERQLFDVGCGTGGFLAAARARGFEPSGIDFDADNVARARSRHGLADVEALSLAEYTTRHPQRRFDAVTLFEVIEHVEDPVAFLGEVRQALRPRGLVALSTPNRDRRFDPLRDGDLPPNHLTRWRPEALATLVRRCGFEVEFLAVKPLGVDDVAGALRARLRLGVARRMLARSMAGGDTGGTSRARFLMGCKDAALSAAALPVVPVARLWRWAGVGMLCVARSQS